MLSLQGPNKKFSNQYCFNSLGYQKTFRAAERKKTRNKIFLAAKTFFILLPFKVLLFLIVSILLRKKNFFNFLFHFNFFSVLFSLKNLSNSNSGKIRRILKFPFEAEGCCHFL